MGIEQELLLQQSELHWHMGGLASGHTE